MFTGIIAEVGRVKKMGRKRLSSLLEVACSKVGPDLALGDSVAVNGVCLSIVQKKKETLTFDVVGNTLDKTNLRRLKPGDPVNLESALRMGDPVSGHMVSGHVDGERLITTNRRTSAGWVVDIELKQDDGAYVVPKGSVAIDGISLTVGELSRNTMRIFLIPHTLENTALGSKNAGDTVNVEFDMMGKYSEKKAAGKITMETLRNKGFL